jgi:hypothetical protein
LPELLQNLRYLFKASVQQEKPFIENGIHRRQISKSRIDNRVIGIYFGLFSCIWYVSFDILL